MGIQIPVGSNPFQSARVVEREHGHLGMLRRSIHSKTMSYLAQA